MNRAWRTFAQANGADPDRVSEGANYLETCDRAVGVDFEQARSAAAGIRAVLAGRRGAFALEYPCHSPDENRWFTVRVAGFPGDGPPRAVVAHETITERKQAEQSLKENETKLKTLLKYFPWESPSSTKIVTLW